MTCELCGLEIVDPTARGVGVRITGWQVKGSGESRKSGSDIVGREPTGEVACSGCIASLKQRVPVGQGSFDIEERTEPLCSDCYAEVTWIQLERGERKRMPVDRKPLALNDPRRGQVLAHPRRDVGIVLRDADLAAAKRRLAQGYRLFRPHRLSCRSVMRSAA